MKRAARLLPQVSRSACQTLARPALISTPSQAGPSSLRPRHFSGTPVSYFYSTALSLSKDISEPIEAAAADEDFEELSEEELEEEILNAEEQVEGALAESWRSVALHTAPLGSQDPILLPVSSLSTPSPALADGTGFAVALPRQMYTERVRKDILHRCVVWYRSTLRQGTHKTKSRAEVAYSGKKLRPQKKTGRARLGDRSNPMMRGGAMAHPKRPRNYAQKLPRKVRALGMRMALTAKLDMGLLRVVRNVNEATWTKTRHAVAGLTTHWRWQQAPQGQPSQDESEEVVGTVVEHAPPAGTEMLESSSSEAEVEMEEGQPEVLEGEWKLAEGFGRRPLPRLAKHRRKFEKTQGKALMKEEELSVLFVYPPSKPATEIQHFARPIRNLQKVEFLSTEELQVYHILKYRWLVMEGGAIDALALQKGQLKVEADEEEWDEIDEIPAEPETSVLETVPSAGESKTADIAISAVEATTAPKPTPVTEPNTQPTDIYPHPIHADAQVRRPSDWIVHKWRKKHGPRSMNGTFGQKNFTKTQNEARSVWRKIERMGIKPTPDMVAIGLSVKNSWPEGRQERIVP